MSATPPGRNHALLTGLTDKSQLAQERTLDMLAKEHAVWPVAVFAHNVQGQIADCLQSLEEATSQRHRIKVFILENGSRDETAQVVQSLRGRLSFPVSLVRISVADKANAWNFFVHEIGPKGEVVFFIDGDVQVLPRSFDYLYEGLAKNPSGLAGAAVPHSGRSSASMRQYILEKHEIAGNLYALRGDTIEKLRRLRINIPYGYIGDDDFLTFLLLFDFDPRRSPDPTNIVPCPEARFYYPSLSLRKWRDWKLYYRRKRRYSLRHFQDQMLFRTLKAKGIQALPSNVTDLYQVASHLSGPIRGSLSLLWFDWLAKLAIKKAIKVNCAPSSS